MNLRGYGGVLNQTLEKHHSSNIVWTKDLHFRLFKVRMVGYSEAIHPKIGVRKMEIIIFMSKMIKHGYFQWKINLNLRLNKIKSNMQSETVNTY